MCVRAIQLVADRLCLTDPEWQSKDLVGEAEMWKKAGILRATKRYTTVDCDCDEQLHQADVMEFERDGKTKYMAFCSLTGGAREVKEEELIGYTFQPAKVAELFHSLFRCRADVEMIIPGRLWKMGRSGVPVAGRSRDIYFTPRLNDDPQDIYSKLPDTKTPLLIVGSSRYSKCLTNPYEDNRIVSLDTILMIQDDKWALDMEWLHQLASDAPDEEPEPETRDATATTVGAIKKVLHEYLETQYRHYCNELRKGDGSQLAKPITQEFLAERIGKSKPRVSALLELKTPLKKCKHPEIRALWDASHDLNLMVSYGNKHWGSRRKTA
mgnify:FL=1|nr:MAG TPA: KorB domain [Caudoviricetes sp.]